MVEGGWLHVADDRETEALWPAVKAAHVFDERSEYVAFREGGPWRVLSDGAGAAAVVERWRDHLDILAIRGLWARPADVHLAARSVMRHAADQGFGRVLSPLVAEDGAGAYEVAGCRVHQRIIVLREKAAAFRGVGPRSVSGVELRLLRSEDTAALCELDARCFDDFWRYEPGRIRERLRDGRVTVADSGEGLIGYTHATVHRGTGTIGRLAVAPEARRRGVGTALLLDVLGYFARSSASEVSLCTQEENVASRTLYDRVGLAEVPGRLLFLMGEAGAVEADDPTAREGRGQ